MNATNIILLVLSGLVVIIALYPNHNHPLQESSDLLQYKKQAVL